jgi:hypothetical protein
MNNINRFILACTIILILIPLVSALDKNFFISASTSKYGATEIVDCGFLNTGCWLGGKGDKVAAYELKTNSDSCLLNCYATGTATLYEPEQLFSSIKFLDKNSKVTSIEDYKILLEEIYVVDVLDFKRVCTLIEPKNGTKSYELCTDEKSGTTHKETQKRFVKYNNEILPIGSYSWRIEAKKSQSQSIDWIATAFGESLDNWAWWINTSSIYDKTTAAWGFDENTGVNIKDDLFGKLNGTLSGINEDKNWSTNIKVYNTSALYLKGAKVNITNFVLGAGNYTLTGWAMFNDTTNSRCIVGDPNIPNGFCFGSGSGKLAIWMGNDSASWNIANAVKSKDSYVVGTWLFYSLRRTDGNVTLFINGTVQSSFNYTNNFQLKQTNLTFGYGAEQNEFYGYIDAFAFFNTSLSNDEINAIYMSPDSDVHPMTTFTENSQTFNSTSTEYSIESFLINVTYNETLFTSISSNLTYNGTSYVGQKSGTGNNVLFSKTLNIPATPSIQNKSFYWTTALTNSTGTYYFNSTFKNQTIYPLLFGPCDSAINLTTKVLNISFIDETTGLYMNATMDSSSWIYSPSINSATKTFTFSNTTHNKEYNFCIYPSFLSYITSSETLQYSHSESGTYPQRRVVFNETYFNSTLTNKILYLLNFNNGITSNYQVISVGNQVIPGAYIKVERLIGSSLVKLTDGYTDNAGTISFFLNPNYDHILTISKTGYTTQTQTIRPSGGTYTITLGTASNYFYYANPTEGITWVIYPPSGILESGRYNFSLQVYSRNSNIYNCSFNIKYLNGSVYNSTYGCNSSYPNMGTGGTIAKMINFTSKGLLIGEYFITTTNNTLIKLEGDARWREVNFNKSYYGTSIMSALNDSLNLPEWGGNCPDGYTINQSDLYCYANDGSGDKIWNQTTDFNRIVFFFLFFVIILAILNFYIGYDTAYPGAFILVMTLVVLILTGFNGIAGPGWFYLYGVANSDFFCNSSYRIIGSSCDYMSKIIENWIVAFYFVLLSVIYLATTMKRYQTG